MSIYKVLDLSTGHVTKKDSELLAELSDPKVPSPFRIISHEYGFFINVQWQQEEYEQEEIKAIAMDEGFSTAILELYDFAAKNKCSWINLDVDGEIVEELSSFDW